MGVQQPMAKRQKTEVEIAPLHSRTHVGTLTKPILPPQNSVESVVVNDITYILPYFLPRESQHKTNRIQTFTPAPMATETTGRRISINHLSWHCNHQVSRIEGIKGGIAETSTAWISPFIAPSMYLGADHSDHIRFDFVTFPDLTECLCISLFPNADPMIRIRINRNVKMIYTYEIHNKQ